MTDVSVVIVSYETRPLLARCLAALAADAGRRASTEVIVVDQASQDGTAAWLAAERPEVRLVACRRTSVSGRATTAAPPWRPAAGCCS